MNCGKENVFEWMLSIFKEEPFHSAHKLSNFLLRKVAI